MCIYQQFTLYNVIGGKISKIEKEITSRPSSKDLCRFVSQSKCDFSQTQHAPWEETHLSYVFNFPFCQRVKIKHWVCVTVCVLSSLEEKLPSVYMHSDNST